MSNIQNAITAVKEAARAYVAANPEGPNWYPCGFAWLTYKCRKNAKEASTLIAEGFRWDDYNKRFTLSAYNFANTQSMCYQEDILRAAVEAAKPYGVEFYVSSRID